jgi:toxin ParE1/3/4
MVEIKWSEQALQDIDQIAEYISKDSFLYAQNVVGRIFSIESILEKQPKIGKPVKEFTRVSLKEIVEGNYRVIYKIVSRSEIHIITVHHGARKLTLKSLKGSL